MLNASMIDNFILKHYSYYMKISEVISKILNDDSVIKEINFMQNNQDIYFAKTFIGEVLRYCIIHKGDVKAEEVCTYLQQLKGIYSKAHKQTDPTFFESERAKLIIKSISLHLNFNKDYEELSHEEQQKIGEYFLKNYVKEGYVFHSFPSAREQSVKKHGFTTIEQIWEHQKVKEVAKIFEKHGLLTALGGYNFYDDNVTNTTNGSNKIYVEHNPEEVFFHCLSSPEWFKFFTSSYHAANSNDLAHSPFYLKNYEACRQNVEDLCNNANLTAEETKTVIALFEHLWKTKGLGNPKLTTALIKKKAISKHKVAKATIKNQSLIDTINTVLLDRTHQFDEHIGNVVDASEIDAEDCEILELPPADRFLTCSQFRRETRKELYSPKRNIQALAKGMMGGLNGSYTQFSLLISNIEQVIKENGGNLNDIDNCIAVVLEKIEQSTLPASQKKSIIDTINNYNTHYINEAKNNKVT